MVIAVPASLVVQRDYEEVGAFEIFQGLLPGSESKVQSRKFKAGRRSSDLGLWTLDFGLAIIEQYGITKRPAQAIENRGAQQESLDAFRLLLQDFFNQIVHHEIVAAGERFDEAAGILMPLQRNRGQLQTSNPAFGAGFQCVDLFCRKV